MIGPVMAGFYIKYTNIRNLWLLIALLALIGSFMMYKLYTADKMELESVKNKTA